MPEKNNFPILSKAPIKVAIIEIRFKLNEPRLNSKDQSQFHELIKSKYPITNKGVYRNIDLQEGTDGSAKATVTDAEIAEFRFISKEKDKILTVYKDKFNFNQTGLYSSWQELISEYRALWELYWEQIINKENLIFTGLSVRYINTIELSDINDPSEYFNTTIYANEGVIPGTVNSFLMRYGVSLEDDNVQMNIIQGLETPVGEMNNYFFDIDVIYNKPIEYENIWGAFERLRFLKNQMFFNNLTDKTIKLLS